jgi:hypothetical protein
MMSSLSIGVRIAGCGAACEVGSIDRIRDASWVELFASEVGQIRVMVAVSSVDWTRW